jgi:hypothetical protein
VTMQAARAQLELAVEGAWAAVGELVLIALEDQPSAGSLAAADDLAEQVSEIQGALAGARDALTAPSLSPSPLPEVLPVVTAGLTEAERRYWQRVRAHGPITHLRVATRRLGGPWPEWRRSVEQTALGCEEPLSQATTAAQLCGQEICDLVRFSRTTSSGGCRGPR